MSRKAWKLAVVILAAGAIATADAGGPNVASQPQLPRPGSADQVCSDVQVGKTFGGDHAGCRQYLDACLSELTDSQRAQWRRSVDSCLQGEDTLYSCYAEVPWC
ncbi:MAG TPA: hypothetical protein VIV40_08405 [Kofleriaceae bacterium]